MNDKNISIKKVCLVLFAIVIILAVGKPVLAQEVSQEDVDVVVRYIRTTETPEKESATDKKEKVTLSPAQTKSQTSVLRTVPETGDDNNITGIGITLVLSAVAGSLILWKKIRT
ncbi:LPXTG cell wall anchor domain-containing protein [Blautia sp. MSJ-19]|uniref:LPXTG cell wall anchor domain-containing protein n=1 Tax=Blautia sp. MSJ-19 TaxID=2841517 RepID=UPI001C0F02C4|nr:LPXTG cell wall anchor domain-containing protein [Blautia sp. MSJ-19]